VELQIRANGVKVTQGMREFIDRRMSKLDRLADHVTDAMLELKAEKTRTGAEISTAQLTLRTGKHVLRAEAEDAEVAKAIDTAIDKLIRQVRKYNDRRTTRRKEAAPLKELVAVPPMEETIPTDLSFSDGAQEEEVPEGLAAIARTKTFQMDPMGVETAIEQMELVGHDFFFFKNAEDEKFSVLYRRSDGTYGLLSPE
jgi:putative sigma-54 modulation protein